MQQSVLIYNPYSGGQISERQVPGVVRELRASGFDALPEKTRGPGDASHLARQAAAGGAEVVFAMGGDGTLREAAAGLLAAGYGSGPALGVLPTGTTNVLSLALGLPRSAVAAARAVAAGEPRAIDVGWIGDQPFLMMASLGLDAAVMARQNPALKRYLGRAAIAWSGLTQWWTYGYPPIEVSAEGRQIEASLAVFSNIPFYGGGMRMAPRADMTDGLLDIVLFRGRGRAATLGFARDLLRGCHLERFDVEILRLDHAEVVVAPGLQVQIDGDVLPLSGSLSVRVERRRLPVLLPKHHP